MLKTLLRRLMGKPAQRAVPPLRRSARPRLEYLEDRLVPATNIVSTLDDSGAGSLRAAITDSNTSGNGIEFCVGGTISLFSALPTLTSNYVINCSNGNITVERNSSALGYFRIFTIASGASDGIYGITIQKGQLDGDEGAGILNDGTLSLAGVSIIYNTTTTMRYN